MTTNDDSVRQTAILLDILRERLKQDEKWGANRDLDDKTWLAILVEEVGETAMAMLDHDGTVREELIQVAAVALAWLECLDRNAPQKSPVETISPVTTTSNTYQFTTKFFCWCGDESYSQKYGGACGPNGCLKNMH